MRISYVGALFLLLTFPLCAQTSLSGIINQYTKVTSLDPCTAILTVDNASVLNVGDPVLLMQMKGASIDESNSSAFGNVEELGSAGRYELNEISAINGQEVSLKYALVNQYDVQGTVQLITVASYGAAVVSDTVTALAWDGQKGGVVAIRVDGALTLEAPVDVSGKGFRGGAINVVSSDCNFLTNADDYHYSMSNWKGAPKGEGIAEVIAGKEQGRGAQANGGGGGNDHNSGGGGGANITGGGDGGKQSVSGFGCDGDFPGRAGKAIANHNHRLFLGGGGGAGHVNNAGSGSSGADGGGIVIIIADVIYGNGQAIISNGRTPNGGVATNGDGQGGGGAGGSILIDASEISGGLTIRATGGDGGNAINPSNRCFGPGGGGSGGRLVSTGISFTEVDLKGGNAGVNINPSGECGDPSNGADDGAQGLQTLFNGIDQSGTEPVETQVLMQPASATGCESIQVTFEMLIQGIKLSFQWQENDGSGWQDIANGPNFAGIHSASLTIFNVDPSMDNNQYRVLVSGPCTSDIVSMPATLTVIEPPQPSFNHSSAGGGTIQFENTSANAQSYSWDFGDGTTSDEENPQHTYGQFGTYTVTLTASNDCGSVIYEQTIFIQAPPSAGFIVDITSGCAPLPVQFINQSSANADSWQWSFPGGLPPASNDENPGVVYTAAGVYDVMLIASNDEGSDTLLLTDAITVNGTPNVDFLAQVDGLDVEFVNLTTNAGGGFEWNFGDGSFSTGVSPAHTYSSDGYYDVTLTAYNDCGQSSITQTIATGSFPLAAFNAEFTGNCAPMTVYYSDQSSGSNLLSYLWEFEGGIPATSVSQNPVVIYQNPGTYSVKLTVGNSIGQHTVEKVDYVVVEEVPVADFDFMVDGMTVQFYNNSTNTNFVEWDFGDGTFSQEQDPFHTYAQGGLYDVILTVANTGCGSAISEQVLIEQLSAAEEGQHGGTIRLFPNPASDFVTIETDRTPPGGTTVRAIGINGHVVATGELTGTVANLDLSGLPAGIYIVSIENDRWQRKFRIVVID